MSYEGYECLRVRLEEGVAWVTIDHPPINLFDAALMRALWAFGESAERDDAVRVIVFQSADPTFFIAHADVNLILALPLEPPPASETLSFFHALVDRFRTMPKATIAKVAGIARGGGSEFVLSCDLRFGALGRTLLAQPEVALGIIPGGSGTQRLPRPAALPVARERLQQFLAAGGQTRAIEQGTLDFGTWLPKAVRGGS